MDDSNYFRINVAATNKVKQRLSIAICFLITIVISATPQLNTLQLMLSSFTISLVSLFTFLVKTRRPTPHLILLTENGQTTLVFVKSKAIKKSLLEARHSSNTECLPSDYKLSQDLQIQSGSWVLFGCLHIKLQSRLSGQKTRVTLYSDQVVASDWCRLRRICLRCNRPAPIC